MAYAPEGLRFLRVAGKSCLSAIETRTKPTYRVTRAESGKDLRGKAERKRGQYSGKETQA